MASPNQTWLADLKRRKDALAAFTSLVRGSVDANGFVWGDGQYLVVHYDLMTISQTGAKLDRPAYGTIRELLTNRGGVHIGETVLAVPLPANEVSELAAAKLWNALAQATASVLVEGDAFYMHYSPTHQNDIGCIAQVVPAAGTKLSTVKPPAPKQGT